MSNWKIFYRGDTRIPDEVFETGFLPRTPSLDNEFKAIKGGSLGDSVAVTALFSVAAAFPVTPGVTTTFAYIVAVDVSNERLYQDFFRTQLSFTSESEFPILPFVQFAQEHATKGIPRHNILCVFPIEKILDKNGFPREFIIRGESILNPYAELDPSLASLYQTIHEQYRLQINTRQQTPIPFPIYPFLPSQGIKDLIDDQYRGQYFFSNKFEPTVQRVSLRKKSLFTKTEQYEKFRAASQYQNEAGILFKDSKNALCKHNFLFFQSLQNKPPVKSDRATQAIDRFLGTAMETSNLAVLSDEDKAFLDENCDQFPLLTPKFRGGLS